MGVNSTFRRRDFLKKEEVTALENALMSALIENAKRDIPAQDIDIRQAIPADPGAAGPTGVGDITLGTEATGTNANRWQFTLLAPGTMSQLVNHNIADTTNIGILSFTDVSRTSSVVRFVQGNGTVLALMDTQLLMNDEFPEGFVMNQFIFEKNENIQIEAENSGAAGSTPTVDFLMNIFIAEQAGTTVGIKA